MKNSVAAASTGEALGRAAGGSEPGLLQVWLVDDSENFRSLLASLLDDEGGLSCSRQFPTAEAVIAALQTQTGPDVILLDVRMPGMGGVAAVRPIKLLAPLTQVLMLTTFFDSQAKLQALQDGAADLMLKTFHLEEIAQRVRAVCADPEGYFKANHPEANDHSFSSRPARRSSEANPARLHHLQGEPLPKPGRWNSSGKCHSNRWVRGVRFLQSMMGQAIGKAVKGKAPGTPAPLMEPMNEDPAFSPKPEEC